MKSYQNSPPHALVSDEDSSPIQVKGHDARRRLCFGLKFVVGLSMLFHIFAVSRLAVRSSGSSYTKTTHLGSVMLETNVLAAPNPSYVRREKEGRPNSKQKHTKKSEQKDADDSSKQNTTFSIEKLTIQNHFQNETVKSYQSRNGSVKESSADNNGHEYHSTSNDSSETSQGKHHHHKHVDVHVVVDDDDTSPNPNQMNKDQNSENSDSNQQQDESNSGFEPNQRNSDQNSAHSNSNQQQYESNSGFKPKQRNSNQNSEKSNSNQYQSNAGFDWQKCVNSKDPDCWNGANSPSKPHQTYESTAPTTSFDWKEYATKLKSELEKCMHSSDPDCWKKVFAGDKEVSSPPPQAYRGTLPPSAPPTPSPTQDPSAAPSVTPSTTPSVPPTPSLSAAPSATPLALPIQSPTSPLSAAPSSRTNHSSHNKHRPSPQTKFAESISPATAVPTKTSSVTTSTAASATVI
eukprot:scaffold7349_cov173-Amphora_coffeaeformis.AAC.94